MCPVCVPGMAGPGPGHSRAAPGRGRCRPQHERDAVALGAQQQHHEAGKDLGNSPGTARDCRRSRENSLCTVLISEQGYLGWQGWCWTDALSEPMLFCHGVADGFVAFKIMFWACLGLLDVSSL